MRTIQRAEVVAQGGRTGTVESSEGNLRLQMIDPKVSLAGDGSYPEELFAAAYAACFNGALLNAARTAHLPTEGLTVTATVSLEEEPDNDEYYLAVELRASLPGIKRSEAERLLHRAHDTCPYSKALRGNADVKLVLD